MDSMTVDQLLAKLKELSEAGYGNHAVAFGYNYGDYWRTDVAKPITDTSLMHVVYSDYHRMDKTIDQNAIDDVVSTMDHEHPDVEYDLDEPETGLEYQGKPIKCIVMLS